MADGTHSGSDPGGDLDEETVATRLDVVERYLEHLRDSTPYYEWLDPEVLAVERGLVRVRQPVTERTEPPDVGPGQGINGGVLMTLGDAVGMAAIIAESLEPVPLATTHVDMSFHDGFDEAHVVEAEVVDVGTTLATARIEVYPDSDRGAGERRLAATGEATARLFEDDD